MPINRSLDDLPRSKTAQGNPPARNNFVAEALAQSWFDRMAKDDFAEHAIPEAGPYRSSFASKRCNRALYYALRKTQPSNPAGLADIWRMGLGTTVHEMLQSLLPELFPGAEVEVVVDLNRIGVPGSGRVDIVFNYKDVRTLVEIKTINGFGFKAAATSFKGPAEGPRSGHVLQAALAAKALGCQQIVIAYMSLENVSPQLASAYASSEAGRFAAEWHYTLDELEPLIATEKARILSVLAAAENPASKPVPRYLVDHDVPALAEITDPTHGVWVALESPGSRTIAATGDTWMCGYCEYRDRCLADGA